MGEAIQLPGRECRCQGDGQTWATWADCPVHDASTSPTSRALEERWQEGRMASALWAADQWREVAQELAEAVRNAEKHFDPECGWCKLARRALARFDALNTEEKRDG